MLCSYCLGCIFHVRLSTTSNLDHATLYSISVNLPAHRADQLDRVLIVASPINDINLHAWDINKVKRFIELDIGIRMELCHSCYRGRSMTTTFIMEKQFVKDCVAFLCKEAQITDPPIVENGLFIYTVAHHKCSTSPVQDKADVSVEADEASKDNDPPPIPPRPPRKSSNEALSLSSKSMDKSNSAVHVCINNSNDVTTADDNRRSRCFTTTSVDVTFNREQTSQPKPVKPAIPIPEYWDDYTGSDSCTGGTGMESLFMADGSLSTTKTTPDPPKETKSSPTALPPRTIPRKDHESSIPAVKQPYYNYQPHLFNHRENKCFDAPYQISSRIIIKDSGEVQFERNIMGNQPSKRHGGFHFKQQIPIPPRGLRADTDLRGKATVGGNGTSSGGNPSLQTNFNFQTSASAAANLRGNGSQFSQEVSASVNATVGVAAPPIPPRSSRKSSSGASMTSSHSSQPTCKSPVPLPRTNISSSSLSSIRKSTDFETFIDNEAYCRHFVSVGDPNAMSHLAGLPQPKTFPVLPRRGVTFGPSQTDSDSELASLSHKYDGGQGLPSMKSEGSDESDAYVDPNTPPLGFSRSDSKNTLSPPYIDDSQFILETQPDYLRLVAVKEELTAQTILTDEQVEPSVQGEHRNDDESATWRSENELVRMDISASTNSLEPDDKECDFEDAASIEFIQSTYRRRCGSSSSTPHGAIESSTRLSLFASYSSQISLEDVKSGQGQEFETKPPEVPPRKSSNYKEPEQQIKYENTLLTISQETTESEATASCTCTSSSTTSGSDQSLLESQSGNGNDFNGATRHTKPLPRPRSKNKVVLSKSLNVLSCSDSNLLDSVNDASSETHWSISAGQKSTSMSTRFFLDDAGIGVSEL